MSAVYAKLGLPVPFGYRRREAKRHHAWLVAMGLYNNPDGSLDKKKELAARPKFVRNHAEVRKYTGKSADNRRTWEDIGKRHGVDVVNTPDPTKPEQIGYSTVKGMMRSLVMSGLDRVRKTKAKTGDNSPVTVAFSTNPNS